MCDELHMATNIQLDEELIKEAVSLGKHPSKRAAVESALREYVRRRKQMEIFELAGKIEYFEDYDYKEGRRKR